MGSPEADAVELLTADSLGKAPQAVLPQKNTFVHFEDEELLILHPSRSVTCPGSTVGRGSVPEIETDLSEGEYALENLVHQKAQEKKRWADLSEDDQTPAHQKAQETKRWVELSEDEQAPAHQKRSLDDQAKQKASDDGMSTSSSSPPSEENYEAPGTMVCRGSGSSLPEDETDLSEDEHATEVLAHQKAQEKKRWADLSQDDQTPAHQKAQENKRWVELSEDEQAPAHQKRSLDDQASDDAESEENYEAPEPPKPCRPARPQFAKPTREARARQFQAKLDECFGLDFDQVDPSQQDGLTHRMLCTLKSLGECVNLWQPDGTQVSEEGFRLLGLEESDMYALGRVIRKADKLLEERRFREAYDKLCTARRWFDPDTVMEERAKAAAHAEKKEKKDKEKVGDSGDDGWTEVKKKVKMTVCDVDKEDDWVEVKKKDKKKSTDARPQTEHPFSKVTTAKNVAPKTEKPFSLISNQGPSLRPQAANLRPQAPSHRPQSSNLNGAGEDSGFKTQSGKGRKGPQKLLCRYNVCIEQDRPFNVVRKLLGDRGCHMKSIAENTGAKLRIRGRGSGFCEGPEQKEASDEPLMVCISAATRESFDSAVEDVESLLEHVQDQYREFCRDRKMPAPKLSVVQNKQPTH